MTRPAGISQGPFYALALATLIVLVLWLTRDQAVPIAIAVLIWFLINALAKALRSVLAPAVALPRMLSKLLSMLILFGIGFAAGNMITAGVAELAVDAADRQGAVLARIRDLATDLGLEAVLDPDRLIGMIDPERWIGTVIEIARDVISNISLVALYVLFLLVDERFYGAKMRALFPDEARRTEVRATMASIGETTRLYLWLMSLVSAGVAIVTYAVCVAVGLNGAGLWGFLAFGLNFVPTIGSILAVLLPGLYGLATLGEPAALLLMVGLLGATQFVAGEIVVPRLMGSRMNLSSFVILFVLVAWGAIWGAVGMFLAIPVTVMLLLVAARFEPTRPIAILLSKDGIVPEVVRPPPPAEGA